MRLAKGLLAVGSASLLVGGGLGWWTGLAAGGVLVLAGLLRLGGASWFRVLGFGGSLLAGLVAVLHDFGPFSGANAATLGVLFVTIWLVPWGVVSFGWAVRRRDVK
ncbi:MAG: hypothetical protein Kow00109_12780 [Acidobacteriota bacterium]